MKINRLFLAAVAAALVTTAQAQVKIGSNPASISTNAVLDVEGTNGTHSVVLQNGFVGVGTATPSSMLHVAQAAVQTATTGHMPLTVTTPNGSTVSGITLGYYGSSQWANIEYKTYDPNRPFIEFATFNAGTPVFQFDLSSGAAYKTGGGTWQNVSDARLKHDVHNYNKGLKEIMAIRPVYFKYIKEANQGSTDKQYVGVLAEEIEKVLPSTVSIAPKGVQKVADQRVFDASELTFTLIKAVQEQQTQIQTLQKQNATMKALAARAKASQRSYAQLSKQVKDMQALLGVNTNAKSAKKAVAMK